MLKKKIWHNFPRMIEVFTQKILTKPSKIWVWDPGSEIRDPEETYSGSRIQGSKRHRIPDPGSESATLPETFITKAGQNRRQLADSTTFLSIDIVDNLLSIILKLGFIDSWTLNSPACSTSRIIDRKY
jgi:hypothetical protein